MAARARGPRAVSAAATKRQAPPAAAEGPIGTRAAHAYVTERLPGWPLSLRTFEYHVKNGHIPALRLGRRYLLWRHELDAWLGSRVGLRPAVEG
jgi:excisionase family DNA binding protein